jgi:hypothetical protein
MSVPIGRIGLFGKGLLFPPAEQQKQNCIMENKTIRDGRQLRPFAGILQNEQLRYSDHQQGAGICHQPHRHLHPARQGGATQKPGTVSAQNASLVREGRKLRNYLDAIFRAVDANNP